MLTHKITALEATRAKLSRLERAVARELHLELAVLPSRYGFYDIEAFVAALRAAHRGRRGRSAAAPGAKKRYRAVITDQTRAQVKALVGAGKTGAEIAAKLKISLPSVQNIKKALGLVKARAK
jgi:hypothetical protein